MPSNIAVGNGVNKCNTSYALNRNVQRAIAGGGSVNTAFTAVPLSKPSTMDGDQNTINYSIGGLAKPNTSAGLGTVKSIDMGDEVPKGNKVAGVGGNNVKTSDYQVKDDNFPVKYDIHGKSVNRSNIFGLLYTYDDARTNGLGDTASKYGRTAGYRYVYKTGSSTSTRAGTTQTQ